VEPPRVRRGQSLVTSFHERVAVLGPVCPGLRLAATLCDTGVPVVECCLVLADSQVVADRHLPMNENDAMQLSLPRFQQSWKASIVVPGMVVAALSGVEAAAYSSPSSPEHMPEAPTRSAHAGHQGIKS
jgi:hypothetical protein